jgi:hypothetical protein
MNIVRAQRGQLYGLGQAIDPSTGIIADMQLGPEDSPIIPVQADYGSTSTTGWSDYGAPSVPQPSSSPSPAPTTGSPSSSPLLSPYQQYGSIFSQPGYAGGGISVPSPAPRVNIPTNTAGGLLASSLGGIPMVAILGIGIVGLLALSGGGGRRRR